MSRLMHEDMKRKEQDGGIEGAAHHQFMSRDNKRKRRPVKKTGACHNCGRQGHWIAECPSRIQEDAEEQVPACECCSRSRSQQLPDFGWWRKDEVE